MKKPTSTIHKITMTFLFDSAECFEETWHLRAINARFAWKHLENIACARNVFLAGNCRIVQIGVDRLPPRAIDLVGMGRPYANPRSYYPLRVNDVATKKSIRGIAGVGS